MQSQSCRLFRQSGQRPSNNNRHYTTQFLSDNAPSEYRYGRDSMFYGDSNSRNDNVFSTTKRNTLVANSGRKPRVECGQRVDLFDREDLVLPREELTLCKGTDNLPYTIRLSQESVLQASTRSIFRPVLVTFAPLLLYPREQPILVGGLTYIGSRRDQYRYISSTYIGQPADQYRFTSPPHGGRLKGLIRHSGVPSARDTKRPHEEGSTDSASTPTEVG